MIQIFKECWVVEWGVSIGVGGATIFHGVNSHSSACWKSIKEYRQEEPGGACGLCVWAACQVSFFSPHPAVRPHILIWTFHSAGRPNILFWTFHIAGRLNNLIWTFQSTSSAARPNPASCPQYITFRRSVTIFIWLAQLSKPWMQVPLAALCKEHNCECKQRCVKHLLTESAHF